MTNEASDFSGTGPVRRGQELPEQRLLDWLETNLPELEGSLRIEQFKGGQSNPTYKLITATKSYVLRRKPAGILLRGAHAVDREYRVTRALFDVGFPVPRPVALCMDEAVVGSSFFIMEFVDGRIFWNSTLPGLSIHERPHYFDALNANLAHLHSLNPAQMGLADFGRPENYLQRQIARWSRQYVEDEQAGRNSDMDRLVEWLPAHAPPGDECRVVHGDYRADNVIFDARKVCVSAVLDWELSTLGHPIVDFTYHLMMYHLPPKVIGGVAGTDLRAMGIPDEEQYIRDYCRRTGRAGIESLDFYLAFNLFRFAAILHGIRGRLVRGTASSSHARTVAANVELVASIAWGKALHGSSVI